MKSKMFVNHIKQIGIVKNIRMLSTETRFIKPMFSVGEGKFIRFPYSLTKGGQTVSLSCSKFIKASPIKINGSMIDNSDKKYDDIKNDILGS